MIKGRILGGNSRHSIDARAICERLTKAAVGEIVEHSELTGIIGRDVRTVARSVLVAAVKRAQSEHRMVFDAVRGVGVIRLGDGEVAKSWRFGMRKIHRQALRTMKRLATVDPSGLPNPERIEHHMGVSVCATIYHGTKESTVERLRPIVSNTNGAAPSAKVLEAFKE